MLRVVRKWRLREVSLVVIPADDLAQMRGQSATAQNLSHNSPSHLPTSATNNSQPTGTEPTAMHPLITFLRGLGLQTGATVDMIRAFALAMTDAQRAQATQLATQHGCPPEIPADLFRSTGTHGGQGSQGATNPANIGGGTPSNPSATIPGSNANPLEGSGQRSGSDGNGQNNVTLPTGGQSGLVPADLLAAERTRAATIRDLAGPDIPVQLVTRALDEGWSIEQAALQFVNARNAARPQPLAAGGQAPFGHVVNNSVTLQTLQAGLLAREGVSFNRLTSHRKVVKLSWDVLKHNGCTVPTRLCNCVVTSPMMLHEQSTPVDGCEIGRLWISLVHAAHSAISILRMIRTNCSNVRCRPKLGMRCSQRTSTLNCSPPTLKQPRLTLNSAM